MIKTYLCQKKLDKVDIGFCFQPGERVLKLDRPKGKVQSRYSGPYRFERYLGRHGRKAKISSVNGSILQLSSIHIHPMLSQ